MLQNGSADFHFYLGANSVDQVYARAFGLNLAINRWYHVAGTYDGVKVRIYIDGVLGGTTPATITIGNTGLLTFGYHDLPGVPYYLPGTLDEVRIWNVARTASEIQATMNQTLTGSESGLAGYWRLNEGSGQIVVDSTANGNYGQLGSTSGIDTNDPIWVLSTAP